METVSATTPCPMHRGPIAMGGSERNTTRNNIPWLMSATRAALGPILILGAASAWHPLALAAIVLTALVSDIFDGILARHWQCDTPAVRLFDTLADTVFYLCTAVALALTQPGIWRSHTALLGALLALELNRLAFDLTKFRKPASYHSYLAKTWGLILAAAVISTFASGHANILVPAALWLGIACNLEGLAMSLILPRWRRDVKTIAAAILMRRETLSR